MLEMDKTKGVLELRIKEMEAVNGVIEGEKKNLERDIKGFKGDII